MSEIRYQRLTRTRTRTLFSVAAASRTSLWLGPDHLLCIDYNGYSESYKRFYFRDIQAITLQQTKRRMIWNIILLTPLFFCGVGLMICLFPYENPGWVIFWSIAAAFFLVPFIINNFLGTACTGQLRTAVQTEELASLSRVPRATKVLERLRPLIADAQGETLSPEEVAARLRKLHAPPAPAPASPSDDPNLPPRLAP